MERRVTFLVLAAFVAAVSCNPVDDGSNGAEEATSFAVDEPKYKYQVPNEKNENAPCTLANMDIAFNLEYKTKDDKTESKMDYEVPKEAKASGTCSSVVSELVLTWVVKEKEKEVESSVKFFLLNNYAKFSVISATVNLTLDSTDFPNAAGERLIKVFKPEKAIFSADLVKGSAKCDKQVIESDKSSMTITSVALIAFNTAKDIKREEGINCDTWQISDSIISGKENDPNATLATMMATFEIPYTQKDGTAEKHTQRGVPLRVENAKSIPSKEGSKQIHSADLVWNDPEHKEKYKLSLTVREHEDGTAYIEAVAADIAVDKDKLKNSELGISRKGNVELRLFPAAPGNGLYSCKTETILRFGDIRITLQNVLFAPFIDKKVWAITNVTVCDSEVKLEEKQFQYVVKGQDVPCILGNMTIKIDVTYKKDKAANEVKSITVPSSAITNGHCDEYMPYMVLTWPGSNDDTKKDIMNKLRLTFKNDKTGLYYVYSVRADIYLHKADFPNAVEPDQYLRSESSMTLKLFPTKTRYGYYNCSNAIEEKMDEAMKIKIQDVLLVAFNDQEDIKTKAMSGCLKEDDNHGGNGDGGNNGNGDGGNNGNGGGGNNGNGDGGNNGNGDGGNNGNGGGGNNGNGDGGNNGNGGGGNNGNGDGGNNGNGGGGNNGNGDGGNNGNGGGNNGNGDGGNNGNGGGNNGNGGGGNNGNGNNGGKDDPKYKMYDYVVLNTKNVPCILANMTISLKMNQPIKDSGTKEVTVKMPQKATHTGTCDDSKPTLEFTWPSKENVADSTKNSLRLTFGRESGRFFLSAIETDVTTEDGLFKGGEGSMMYFAADAASSFYKCEPEVQVTASNFTAIFTNVNLIVFNKDADVSKRSEENCSSVAAGPIVGGIIGGLMILGIIGCVVLSCRRSRY